MRQAREAESLPTPSSPDATSVPSPTVTSQPKRNLSAIADADTEDGGRDDGGASEQPKPRTSLLFHLNPPKELTHLSFRRQKATHHA
jgi:hypothetical protein